MVSSNGKEFIISCSWDKKMRAWEVDAPNGKLNGVSEQVLPCDVNDLGVINDTIILGALKTGQLAIWNIADNSVQ